MLTHLIRAALIPVSRLAFRPVIAKALVRVPEAIEWEEPAEAPAARLKDGDGVAANLLMLRPPKGQGQAVWFDHDVEPATVRQLKALVLLSATPWSTSPTSMPSW